MNRTMILLVVRCCCIFSFLIWLEGMQTITAQNVLEKQRTDFAAGNRDTVFLKGYLDALSGKTADALEKEKVLDAYLMALPFVRRYTDVQTDRIVAEISHLESSVVADLVGHWDSLRTSAGNREALARKVDQLISMCANDKWVAKDGKYVFPDLDLLQRNLQHSTIPLVPSKKLLLDLWISYGKADLDATVSDLDRLLERPVKFTSFFDWSILGMVGNWLLEKCDKAGCDRVMDILQKALDAYGKEVDMMTVRKMLEDFSGKKMMLEMGME